MPQKRLWPDERLTNAELFRRCVILGVSTLRYFSPEAATQFVAIYRNYQPPFDGVSRATIPDRGEGDHPRVENFRS